MMDDEMTATAVNSQNPLNIPELLDNILGFLPVKDLKSCRLVNKFWKDTALKPMRTKCAKIKFGRRSKDYHGLLGMQKFLQCFSADPADLDSGLLSSDPEIQDDIPCTKFEIYTGIINKQKSDKEKLIVANFFQAISPWVTEFTLADGKDIGDLLKGVEKLNFPSLKRVVFSKGYYETAAFSPWMSVFIMNSPQLEELKLSSVAGQPYRDPSFFQFLSQNKGLKIKELSIHAAIENNDLLVLSESDLKLKSLTLRLHWTQPQEPITILPQLLQSQSENLEKFSICDFYGYVAEGVPLPVMKQLKALTIDGNYPWMINYVKQTPTLERVVFDEKINWPGFLNGEMQPAPGVKELCFRWTYPYPTAEAILQMGRIFPNIRKLEIQAHKDSLPMVYNSLPNLEELTLNTYVNIDGLLTGLTDKGRQRAVQALGNWTRDFDDSDIQIGRRHSPISVLTNLKLLRLRRDARRRKWEITQVSFCLALMKMPSLQILDVGERLVAPDEMIPCEVLKEFRKNCVILWNNPA